MPTRHDETLRAFGTRFRIYAQPRFLPGFETPETIWVGVPPGAIQAGPADARMYVADAIDKLPYQPTDLPPCRGRLSPPVTAGADGHFDHLDTASREFGAAHIYAITRRVLDIWEGYLGRPIAWHFRDVQRRLELIPYVDWDNAQAGFGYVEAGFGRPKSGETTPFCLNFDVLAHEVGHLIVFSLLGIPDDDTLTSQYLAYHESASDCVALLSALHSDRMIEHLLNGCDGDLYVANELDRLAELSPSEQIRRASHSMRMADVEGTQIPWQRLTQKQRHELGEPMTGALFDILVEIFQERLVERGLISRALADLATRAANGEVDPEATRGEFESAYRRDPAGFADALRAARDVVGIRLAVVWDELSPHHLSLGRAAAKFLTVDRRLSAGRYQDITRAAFLWRQIGFGFAQKSTMN